MTDSGRESRRVLVSAPYGRDAQSVAGFLSESGYEPTVCVSLIEVASALSDDIGIILLTEEALAADLGPLHRALESQPSWSDVPFLLLAGRQAGRAMPTEAIRRRLPESALNVILLERPLSTESLLSAVASAMRARQKQFELRDQLAELESQRVRLSTLIDHLPVGIAFFNSDGSAWLTNPAFRRFSPSEKLPSRDEAARPYWIAIDANGDAVGPADFPGARALRGELAAGTEFLFAPDVGEETWTRVSGVPLHDERGDVVGAISVIVDIDDQKRAQVALERLTKDLEHQVRSRTAELEDALGQLRRETDERAQAEAALRQSQKMEAVGQLTGGIAHDFNNMLTGVIGSIEVMGKRLREGRTGELERYMDAALSSAQRAAGLTARLLAFSRRQSLDSRPTDIAGLVRSLEDLLVRTMMERIQVIVRAEEGPAIGIVDANQLESAILNLAINARDAMPDGGELAIEVRTVTIVEADRADREGLAAGAYVVVAVTDTGSGMDEETLSKVFDPFFTTKPIGQGTGLGLSMVYGFASQSNGQAFISSKLGEGTTVEIYLPAEAAEPDVQGDVGHAAIAPGKGQRVLLVEDEFIVRMLVCDVLEELGYAAIEAGDAEAAIKLLQSGQTFDLMLSDVGLPGMNGRQLAEIAREFDPRLPVLFMTGYAETAMLRSDFLGENMAMIAKPFQVEDLSAKVRAMIA